MPALLARGIAVHGALRLVAGCADSPGAVRLPGHLSPRHAPAQRGAGYPLLLDARHLEQGAGTASVGAELFPVVSGLHEMGVSLEALASVVRDAPAALAPGSELPAVIAWLHARGVGVPVPHACASLRSWWRAATSPSCYATYRESAFHRAKLIEI